MSISPSPPAPPSAGLHPTPPISRGGARAAILARLAAQGRSPDFLDEGAVGRLIDHARGSPRSLRAALDSTLALAAREHAARGDAALVARALDAKAPASVVVPARTRRALWLAGSGFAVASMLLIWFAAAPRPTRVALAPAAIIPQAAPVPSTTLAEPPIMEAAAPALPEPAAATAGPASAPPVQASPPPPSPPPAAQASLTPPPALPGTAPARPSPTATLVEPPPPASPLPAASAPPAAPTPLAAAATQNAPTARMAAPQARPAAPPTLPPLSPAVGVAAPPVPAAPVIAQPPTALVLYAAGAPGVQQRLSSLSTRLRQAGIGQVEKRAVPAGTALGRPVSFFDSGDLALAQRAAGVLASEGWPNLPVDELAPRMIRPRAALRQRHVVIEIQLP